MYFFFFNFINFILKFILSNRMVLAHYLDYYCCECVEIMHQKVAEQQAKLQAEREAAVAEPDARLQEESEAAELETKLQAERDAAELEARIQAERSAAEQETKLQAERDAAELEAKLQAERDAAELLSPLTDARTVRSCAGPKHLPSFFEFLFTAKLSKSL